MEAHVQRMLVEHDELSTKTRDARNFLDSEKSKELLDDDDRMLLECQFAAMEQYQELLASRINKAKNDLKVPEILYSKGDEIIGKFGFENPVVRKIKANTINLINLYNRLGKDARRKAVAITDIESAQMFIVKSLF